MTELEKIQRAKQYMEQLAAGISPIDGRPLPADDPLTHDRLARCFAYTAQILGEVAENGGTVGRPRRTRFALSDEERERFAFSDAPIPVAEIVKRLNALIDPARTRRLTVRRVTDWLFSVGLLEADLDADGRILRYPSEAGAQMGLSRSPHAIYGTAAVLFTREAQQFLIDNLDAVLGA